MSCMSFFIQSSAPSIGECPAPNASIKILFKSSLLGGLDKKDYIPAFLHRSHSF